MIICMDPVLDRSLIRNEGEAIFGYSWLLTSNVGLIGRMEYCSCEWHSLRKAIRSMLGLISPTMTRDQLHAKTGVLVISFVKKWGGQVVDIHEKLKEVSNYFLNH